MVVKVDFEAMSMALINFFLPIHAVSQGAFLQDNFVGSQSHCCAFDFYSPLFRHQIYDWMRGFRIDFGAVCIF